MATTEREHEEGKGIVGTAGGGTAGALGGAAIGAAVGGPVGAAVGAGIGAVSGSAVGAAIDYESHEPEFRKGYEASSTKGSHGWDEVSHAYRYGWEAHDRPEYKGKAWSQVSSDLKKGWTGGKWSDYEPHVKKAWKRRAIYQGQAAGEAVVPVVEEQLQVGKRKVEKGGVKVKTRVTETPVDVQETDTPAVVTDEGFETYRPGFEKHFKSNYGKTGKVTLEEFTPAYRFGYSLAGDERYRSGDWATIEPEARKYWESKNEGTWGEFKEAIHHAWDKARGKA